MNVEVAERCGVCRCYLDSEDLFCANCGTENPVAVEQNQRLEHTASHYSFDCKSCGASMSYDASARALRCPFCGSTEMEKREGARSIRPDGVVTFSIGHEQAEKILREWLGRGFWRPADASRASTIGEMTAVYVPYWVFEAQTETMWTADSSPAPRGSRGDWYPVSGRNSATYPAVLIGGSSILTARETGDIAPFQIGDAQSHDQVDLENTIVEEFRVPRKMARPQARGAIEQLEANACLALVPNRARNLRVNVHLSSMRGYPLLLPVWILAYRYKNNVHRVLINGQSGKIAGSAPFSYGKLTVILLVVAAIVLAVIAVAALSQS